MSVFTSQLKKSCWAILAISLVLPGTAFASKSQPKCKDVKSATNAVNRSTASVARYQAKLEADKAWMNAATQLCTATTPAECKTTQQPKAPIWEGDKCMHYTETFFTCESSFKSFPTNGVTVTYRGKSGNFWQINYKVEGSFPPCPAK